MILAHAIAAEGLGTFCLGWFVVSFALSIVASFYAYKGRRGRLALVLALVVFVPHFGISCFLIPYPEILVLWFILAGAPLGISTCALFLLWADRRARSRENA